MIPLPFYSSLFFLENVKSELLRNKHIISSIVVFPISLEQAWNTMLG